jgi:hypothetical protein
VLEFFQQVQWGAMIITQAGLGLKLQGTTHDMLLGNCLQ